MYTAKAGQLPTRGHASGDCSKPCLQHALQRAFEGSFFIKDVSRLEPSYDS